MDIHDELEKMNHLQVMAAHDSLTGLLNHKTAKTQIEAILSRDTEKKFVLIVFDLDHFKQANDTYGHLFGDEVLKYVADIMKRNGIRIGQFLVRERVRDRRIDEVFPEIREKERTINVRI